MDVRIGPEAMLEVRGLTKRYGAFLALDRVDFQVRRGEILEQSLL